MYFFVNGEPTLEAFLYSVKGYLEGKIFFTRHAVRRSYSGIFRHMQTADYAQIWFEFHGNNYKSF